MTAPAITSKLKFFGALCQQLAADSSLTIKQEIITGFLKRYQGDIGLLFKLLLPKYNGRLYHLQDKQLTKLFALALGVQESQLKADVNQSGCVATSALKFFKAGSDSWCDLSMEDLDLHLDALAKVSAEDQQLAAIRSFVKVACKQALWLYIRQIKQDLRLGAGIRVILSGLHPLANDVFKQCANVQEVVRRVIASDGSSQLLMASPAAAGATSTPAATAITLGTPMSPMLAAPSKGVDQVLAKCPNGAFSETKYDGERIQIHKLDDGQWRFFARSLKPMKSDKFEGLEPFLSKAITPKTCILDGEILLVDIATSQPLPFGTLGKHKKQQFTTACTCIILFDMMYVNGTSLLHVPIEKRREIMKVSISWITNRVMLSEMRYIAGTPEQRTHLLQRHLKHAIAEGLEGLVIKDIRSTYEPGARHWIKLKKDYLDGLADSADLVVLGAYYGTGNKGGMLSIFLMGVCDTSVTVGGAGRWRTVCKAGNGHDDATLAALNERYKVSMTPWQGASPPSWLSVHSSHVPDMVVKNPETADVWEIIGAEFSTTKTHTASEISIRFPRVQRRRDDKDPSTATTLKELIALVQTSKEKSNRLGLAAEIPNDDDDDVNPPEVMARVPTKQTMHMQGQGHPDASTASERLTALLRGVGAATEAAVALSPPSGLTHPSPPLPRCSNEANDTGYEGRDRVVPAAALPTPPHPQDGEVGGADHSAPAAVARSSLLPSVPNTATSASCSTTNNSHVSGEVIYTVGDVAQPLPAPVSADASVAVAEKNVLILHCTAAKGRWSQRGTMGSISKYLGDEPQETYDEMSKSTQVGEVILCEVSNRMTAGSKMFVGTMVAQLPADRPGAVPQADMRALHQCFEKSFSFAAKFQAAVHIAKMDSATGVVWGDVDKWIRAMGREKGIRRIVVYTREGGALARNRTYVVPSVPTDPDGVGSFPPPPPPLPVAPPAGFTRLGFEAPTPSVLMTAGTGSEDEGAVLHGVSVYLSPAFAPREKMLIEQKAVMMGARVKKDEEISEVQQVPSHVVVNGASDSFLERMPQAWLGKHVCVVTRGWIEDAFDRNKRLESAPYAVSISPVADHVPSPQLLGQSAGSDGSFLFDALASERVVLEGFTDTKERDSYATKVAMLGGTVMDRWRTTGSQKTTVMVAAQWTREAQRVSDLGGVVVRKGWIDEALRCGKQPVLTLADSKTSSPWLWSAADGPDPAAPVVVLTAAAPPTPPCVAPVCASPPPATRYDDEEQEQQLKQTAATPARREPTPPHVCFKEQLLEGLTHVTACLALHGRSFFVEGYSCDVSAAIKKAVISLGGTVLPSLPPQSLSGALMLCETWTTVSQPWIQRQRRMLEGGGTQPHHVCLVTSDWLLEVARQKRWVDPMSKRDRFVYGLASQTAAHPVKRPRVDVEPLPPTLIVDTPLGSDDDEQSPPPKASRHEKLVSLSAPLPPTLIPDTLPIGTSLPETESDTDAASTVHASSPESIATQDAEEEVGAAASSSPVVLALDRHTGTVCEAVCTDGGPPSNHLLPPALFHRVVAIVAPMRVEDRDADARVSLNAARRYLVAYGADVVSHAWEWEQEWAQLPEEDSNALHMPTRVVVLLPDVDGVGSIGADDVASQSDRGSQLRRWLREAAQCVAKRPSTTLSGWINLRWIQSVLQLGHLVPFYPLPSPLA